MNMLLMAVNAAAAPTGRAPSVAESGARRSSRRHFLAHDDMASARRLERGFFPFSFGRRRRRSSTAQNDGGGRPVTPA